MHTFFVGLLFSVVLIVGYPIVCSIERISFKLAVITYRSIHGTSPSYLQSCFTQTTAAVFYLSSSGSSTRSSLYSRRLSRLYSRQAGVSGFWCHRLERPLSTSYLRRHSRFSDNDSRPFCFPVPTKTLSYDSTLLPFITTCGPCNNNNKHYLGHVKTVYDDDDDDDSVSHLKTFAIFSVSGPGR